MTEQQLREIEERCEAVVRRLIYAYENCNILKPQYIREPIDDGIKLIKSLQALLALLAEVRRLREENDQQGEMVDEYAKNCERLVCENERLQRERDAAVRDLSTYKDCGFCMHLQDQQYCYKNCQRHVDVDNYRTHPCWQWRGQSGNEGV